MAEPERLDKQVAHAEAPVFQVAATPVAADNAAFRLALAKIGVINAPYLRPIDSMSVTQMNVGAPRTYPRGFYEFNARDRFQAESFDLSIVKKL